MIDREIIRDLGDGLILRRSCPADRDALAEFHANTLLDVGEEPPLERMYYWVHDLMSGAHPGFSPRDFTIVEEAASGKIVSSMALISQTWAYEGIPFRAGQPDIVSTDPAYRRRGLVRAQMEEIHRWSAERGQLVQGITGVPWYYRQFGYEMALSLEAHRVAYRQNVPQLEEGQPEAFQFRPATMADLPFIMAMYEQFAARSVIAAVRDESLWRFDLEGRDDKNGTSSHFRVIEARERPGEPLGLLVYPRLLWGAELGVRLLEVAPHVSWLAVAPSVLRYLDAAGAVSASGADGVFDGVCFALGEQHPLYETIPNRLLGVGRPYAWYIRVPDLPAFVRHITPALEKRLAASTQAGYSGELTISFFRDGLRLTITDGHIEVASWMPGRIEDGDVAFPDLTFLMLLFGHRSLEEIQHIFPDCWAATDDARALLPILFPKKSSRVWPGG